ncbi:MAG: hypothetical protein LBM63_01695 [Rikenellaceae bacterium]|jgi:hypothetical protein|nr:hypothetical protein [Rikenellaceae bacterium]
MKNTLSAMLLCLLFTIGCKQQQLGTSILPDPACIPIFLKTTKGEETILLADSRISEKKGVSKEEQKAIRADFELQYGKENIRTTGGLPVDEEYSSDFNPKTEPNCYELTITIELPESSELSAESIASYYGFLAKRLDEHIVICKRFEWAYSDNSATGWLKYIENSLGRVHNVPTVGTSTIKKLGTEVHNLPIEF